MNPEQAAAFLMSQTVCALAEIEGMKADNTILELRQEYPTHTMDDFIRVTTKYGIDHNSAIMALRGGS